MSKMKKTEVISKIGVIISKLLAELIMNNWYNFTLSTLLARYRLAKLSLYLTVCRLFRFFDETFEQLTTLAKLVHPVLLGKFLRLCAQISFTLSPVLCVVFDLFQLLVDFLNLLFHTHHLLSFFDSGQNKSDWPHLRSIAFGSVTQN